ncbi:uncharacterized protein [Panulirus ornatus]|uniref:uncharacterized protein isoform X2 n=1 Tax=Panulirus ornatus TaxID=150431 RepID=UPI003A8B8914
MGATVAMKEASLEELVEQCTSQKVAVRVPAYRTLTKKCTADSEDVVWSDYASMDDTQKTLANIKADLLNETSDISYEAAGVCGCLLANESFLSLINPENEIEILEILIKAIKETKEKKVLNRSLWSLAKSRLNKNVYVTKNEEIVSTVIGIIKGHDTSTVVVHEALQVIKSLLMVVPDEMGQAAQNWFPNVFGYMFHDAGRVRAAAFATINAGKNILEKANNDEKLEILKMIIPDLKTHHCKQMNHLVGEECIDILKEWRIIVKMLGKELHPGTSLINGLLEVVEKGFKSYKPEIRVDAFKCWEALIDNFSLDNSVLSHSKRLKLLLAPLKANNAKTEDIAHAKLLAWWHLVRKLGKKAAVNFDLVVVPLLRFCFGCASSTGGTVVGLAERNLIMSGAAASPGRKFSGLHVTCAEILAQILSKGVDIAGLQAYVFTIPVLEEPVMTTPTMFIRYHQLLLNCTSEAVQSLNSQERKQYLLGVFLFQSVLAHLRVIITLDTNKKDCVEPVKELFNTIASLERQCCPGDSQSQFTFKFLEMVIVGNLALPKTVLNSRQYHITTDKTMRDMMNGTLSNHLIHQLCRPSLLHFSTVGEGFFTLWLAVLANGKPSVGKLWFLQSVMKELAHAALVLCPDHPSVLVRLWSSVVSQLIEHIEETQMIDQGDGSEHDWSCIYSVLLFPLIQSVDALSSAENHIYQHISTNWNELWVRFIDLTPLTSTEPNSEVEYIAHNLVDICNEKLTAPPDIHAAAYRLMADVLAILTEKLRYSELGKILPKLFHSPAKPKKKPHPLHNLASCIELFGILLRRVLHMVSNERQHVASKLCDAIINVFRGVHQTKLVVFLVAHVVGPLSESLQVNPAARFSYDVEKKFISMFKSFCTLIDEHFGKTHTGDQLTKLVPLFIVALRSSNKNIKLEAYSLWKSSFSSTRFNIPSTLFELLKDCGLPPASLIDLHDKTEESLNLSPKENIPARQAASSFMREAESEGKPQDTANLRSPKADTSKSISISHDSMAAKEKKKIKMNIEDMRDEEFVKVMSPKLKKRVLTEHQIERMAERRCDIPALYSELSQAISQDMLPSQFASQSSFEESASEEPVGSLLKEEDKVQNRIIDPEDIVKTFRSETRNTSNDDLGVQELSFSGKISSESKETEHEDVDDELFKELQVESQRKKPGKGLASKNVDTKSMSVGDRTEQTKKKQDQEACEAEHFELKRKNLSVSSDDEERSHTAEISENTEGVKVTKFKNKVKHKGSHVLDVPNDKKVDTQSKEIDKCIDEEMKNINDKSEKEELTIKADNIRTYSGKKKKDSITRRYGNGDSDYTDEDLNEELRKTSLMLQKSLNDSIAEDSSQTFTPLEPNRRKMQTPVKKTVNDVRRSLKGTALSNKDIVNTGKIDSSHASPKQMKEQRINFKEVAVSPSVIRDDKLMKKIPEVKLTDEAVMIKHMNTKQISDTDSEEEIPNSQVVEELNSHRSVFGHGSRESPVPVLRDRCVEEDSDREAVAKEGSPKYSKAKRKCSLTEENDTISALPDKRKRTGDKNHHSLTEKQNSSDDSVIILEEKVKEQEMGKQISSQRKNKEPPKQQRDGEDFSGRHVKKVAKSPAELLCKNSQNISDSQGNTDRPNSVTSQSTPPKVTRFGRKIVAPNRDMPEPMTPPGASSSKKRIRSQESIVVSYVDDNVPKTETLPVPLNSMPVKKSVQKKITDMFSRDDQRIPNKEFNENFEDCSTLPEMEEITDSLSENDSDIDEYAHGEEESSSSSDVEESVSIAADTDNVAGGANQQVFSGQKLGKMIKETRNELAQESEKISPTRQFPRKFCGSPSKNVQVVDSFVRLSKDQEVASPGDKDAGDNINYVVVLNEPLKIAKISKDLESIGNDGVCDRINTGKNQVSDDYSRKNMAEEVPTPSKAAKSQLATKDQAEKTSDESSSFECGQVVDEHLNEVSRKSSHKELNDSMDKTGNIRDDECVTGIEKGKEIARKSDQNSEKTNDFDKLESTSLRCVKKHMEKSIERELEKCDDENLEELCLKDCQVNAKASGEFGLKDFENRFKDGKERYVDTLDKEALEAFGKVKKSVKVVVKDMENFGAKDTEKDKVSELVKVGEKDLESVSFKYIEKTNLGTRLTAREWEEELSPEKPSKSRLNLAVSTPERQKKKGIAKYAGSRAAMLVAVAKKNIKNRGTSEGESPSKSVTGGEASRYRSGGSPIRRSGTGHFSPTSTPPNRKRKYCDRDSGRPWAKHEPSPGASPSTSILKKKTVLDDSFSRETPSPKRRCVRFTDPLVSDRVEIPPSPKTLKGIRAQKRLDMTKAASPVKDIDFPSPSKESQEADSPAFLDCSQPLYPALITCQDKIDQVAHLLTSSALVSGLLAVCEERGIFTVGHLSQLTEADLYKLPVRAPKISATVKVLKKYEEKLYRESKKSTDPLMDEVEAQLREVLGEVDREDKENLQPNNNFHESRKFVDGEDNLENMETIEDRPSRDSDDVPQVIDDIHGMDEDITPLDASPEDVQPEMIKAICKKAAESPQFLESLADHLDLDAKESLFTHLIKRLHYQFVIDCFYRYLKTKNTGDNT